MTQSTPITAGEYIGTTQISRQPITDAQTLDFLDVHKGAASVKNGKLEEASLLGEHFQRPGIATAGYLAMTVAAAGIAGPTVAVLGAIAVGKMAWDIKRDRNYNNAIALRGALDVSTQAENVQDMVAKQTQLGEDLNNKHNGSLWDDVFAKRVKFIGVMAGGVVAGAALLAVAPALPMIGGMVVAAGMAGAAGSLGAALGEMEGRERDSEMAQRILSRMKGFAENLAERRENAAQLGTPEPGATDRPKGPGL